MILKEASPGRLPWVRTAEGKTYIENINSIFKQVPPIVLIHPGFGSASPYGEAKIKRRFAPFLQTKPSTLAGVRVWRQHRMLKPLGRVALVTIVSLALCQIEKRIEKDFHFKG